MDELTKEGDDGGPRPEDGEGKSPPQTNAGGRADDWNITARIEKEVSDGGE